jgi:hypothetical protein
MPAESLTPDPSVHAAGLDAPLTDLPTTAPITPPEPSHHDPVRGVTAAHLNARIDRETDAALAWYRSRPRHELDGRIDELEREWDIERWLETNASILALSGLALGILRRQAWLALPVVVSGFLLQHAIRGWCPPVWLFRRLGARTRQEIDRELYSLRAMRGDFDGLRGGGSERSGAAVTAAGVNGGRPMLGSVPLQQRDRLSS